MHEGSAFPALQKRKGFCEDGEHKEEEGKFGEAEVCRPRVDNMEDGEIWQEKQRQGDTVGRIMGLGGL